MSDIMLWFVLAVSVWILMIFIRNHLILKYRLKATSMCMKRNNNLNYFKSQPSYNKMVIDLKKWKFEEFYPDLVKPKSVFKIGFDI